MKNQIKSKISLFTSLLLLLLSINWAGEDKKITHIIAKTSADGKSNVSKEILDECIKSLPSVNSLEATTRSTSKFLKGINGDKNKNAHTKVYLAHLEISYMLYQKELVIITTNSVSGQKPVLKEYERNLKRVKLFTSDQSHGDLFAGRSKRQYYFSTPELAIKDAKERARVWLKQQQGGICPDKQ